MANETPATRIAGQISIMRRKPTNAQINQNGTRTEKNGSWRPTIELSACRSSPVTAASTTIGVPSAPKATGAVLAISESPAAASGLNPSPIMIAAVTATGVPKPAAPSKNAPKQNETRSSCSRRSVVMPVMLFCSTSNKPAWLVSWYMKMTFSTIQPIGSRPNSAP